MEMQIHCWRPSQEDRVRHFHLNRQWYLTNNSILVSCHKAWEVTCQHTMVCDEQQQHTVTKLAPLSRPHLSSLHSHYLNWSSQSLLHWVVLIFHLCIVIISIDLQTSRFKEENDLQMTTLNYSRVICIGIVLIRRIVHQIIKKLGRNKIQPTTVRCFHWCWHFRLSMRWRNGECPARQVWTIRNS
jgi:hypothetical protein